MKNIADFSTDAYRCVSNSSTFEQTFHFLGKEDLLRGIYYPETERSIVYLHKHETLDDLVNTCVHETIHHCIFGFTEEEDTFQIDIEQEHDIIRNMVWADFWAVDGVSIINKNLITALISPKEEKHLFFKYNKGFRKNDWF